MKGAAIFCAIALAWTVAGIEFYYTIPVRGEQCFEEHLPEKKLVRGSVALARKGPIILRVENPLGDEVLTRVFAPPVTVSVGDHSGQQE